MPPPTAGGGPVGRGGAGARGRCGSGSRFVAAFFGSGFLFAALAGRVLLFLFFVFVAFFFFVVAGSSGPRRRCVRCRAGRVRAGRRGLEFGAFAFLGGGHERLPDRTGGGAAVAGVFARLRVADPDGGRVHRRVADEPGIGLFLGGAGLAGLAAAADRGVAGAGPGGDHALQDPRHFVGLALGQNPFAGVGAGFVDLAVGELDFADRGRVVVDAAVGEGRVGIGHLQRRDPVGETADPLRRHRFQRRCDAHFFGGLGHVFGADVEVELGEDDVDRVHRRVGQRLAAAAGALGVVDGPGAAARQREGLRRAAVVVGRVGVDALLDRRGQDEGLERGAGLAVRLPGVVELVLRRRSLRSRRGRRSRRFRG